MTIQLADQSMRSLIQENIDFMHDNVLPDDEYGRKYTGFKNYEVAKMERDLAWAKEGLNIDEEKRNDNFIRFYEYFTQYDKRRNLNFLDTFPEMAEFWNRCKKLKEKKYGP